MPFIQDMAFWLKMPIFQQDAKRRHYFYWAASPGDPDLGNKVVARKIMQKAGIPFIPGYGRSGFAGAPVSMRPLLLRRSKDTRSC